MYDVLSSFNELVAKLGLEKGSQISRPVSLARGSFGTMRRRWPRSLGSWKYMVAPGSDEGPSSVSTS